MPSAPTNSNGADPQVRPAAKARLDFYQVLRLTAALLPLRPFSIS